MTPLTVAIAEDHTVFRRELVVALEQDPAIEVVAEAPDLARLLPRLGATPGVVLADVPTPGRPAAEVVGRFLAAGAAPLVAMLGPDEDPGEALLAGAGGAVAKAALLADGPQLVRLAAGGYPLIGPEAGRALVHLAQEAGLVLTPRQQELLRQLAAGRTGTELAGWLGGAEDDARQLVGSTIMELRAAVRRDRRAPGRRTIDGQPTAFPPVDLDPE